MLSTHHYLIVYFLLLPIVQNQPLVLDLGGSDWEVHNHNGIVSLSGTVPGDIFADLIRAKIIDEPYYRYNDLLYRWVGDDSWTYKKSFEVPTDIIGQPLILLVCDGLDTVAELSLNGQVIANTDNMFRSYIIPISSPLTGGQVISITFQSATKYGVAKTAEYPYPVPNSPSLFETAGRNFVRKVQSSFAWNWGPSFIPQGIWQSIRLVGVSSLFVSSAATVVYPGTENDWIVRVSLELLLAPSSKGIDGTFSVSIDGINTTTTTVSFPPMTTSASLPIDLHVAKTAVKLWWPNGYGSPVLYAVTITWHSTTSSPVVITKKVGFRTVELVRKPYKGQVGESFYFSLNGVPVFAKGSNFIPADSFQSRVIFDVLQELLDGAVAANMNMIRNWGGGIYQTDEFYDYCDEIGLMVWEEFMFACAMYPRDKAFLDNVWEEARQQVRRLMHHPSIILWSGNNEDEEALGWYPETKKNPILYAIDQAVLYIETLRACVLGEDTSRPFVTSSPSNGAISTDPYVGRWGDPNSQQYGDVHYYHEVDDCTNESYLPNARFVSEFGFYSYPSYYTWKNVTEPSDLTYNSMLMQHRMRYPGGIDVIVGQMKHHFHVPPQSSSLDTFKDFIYLSQLVQAICTKVQVEHYRRNRDTDFNTMGSLYWMLNDIWQGQTRSSISYGGRWKMLHYFAQKFYNPIIVSSTLDANGNYSVKVVNDFQKDISGTCVIAIYAYANTTLNPVVLVKKNFKVLSQGSLVVYTGPVTSLLEGITPNDVYSVLTLLDDAGQILAQNEYFFTHLVQVNLPNTTVSATQFNKINGNTIRFVVSSTYVAPYVLLETSYEGHFDTNGFLLLPTKKKEVVFYSKTGVEVSEFQSSLQLITVVNTYK